MNNSKSHRWFKNGDHPRDEITYSYHVPEDKLVAELSDFKMSEGKVVGYFNHPLFTHNKICPLCLHFYDAHGYLRDEINADSPMNNHHVSEPAPHEHPLGMVCPGDAIVDVYDQETEKELYIISES